MRNAIYREIEDIAVRDALLLPLFHEVHRFARPEVKGLKLNFVVEVAYEELYIAR